MGFEFKPSRRSSTTWNCVNLHRPAEPSSGLPGPSSRANLFCPCKSQVFQGRRTGKHTMNSRLSCRLDHRVLAACISLRDIANNDRGTFSHPRSRRSRRPMAIGRRGRGALPETIPPISASDSHAVVTTGVPGVCLSPKSGFVSKKHGATSERDSPSPHFPRPHQNNSTYQQRQATMSAGNTT